jgi:response regulator RpfG family c-di-GMP phosphodiesterase
VNHSAGDLPSRRSVASTKEPTSKISLLLVSEDENDRVLLSNALAGTRWNVLQARSCADADKILQTHVVPVIIRDQECCEMGCTHAVRCAQSGLYPIPLIVAANSPDCKLWEEVIDCGGLEVLSKPFDPVRVRKVVDFAWDHWRRGVIRRDWEHFDYPD